MWSSIAKGKITYSKIKLDKKTKKYYYEKQEKNEEKQRIYNWKTNKVELK